MTWSHETPAPLAIWLIFLIPFTIMDAAFVFLRPHTLPGGKWHDPWFRYVDSYATIDLMYSRANWESGDGFVAAHDVLHLVECVLGASYLWLVFAHGHGISSMGLSRKVTGRAASAAVIVGLMEGAMTIEMTLMCTFYAVLGGWHDLGHNSWSTILGSWGLISSLYLFFSTYQTYYCARDIYTGLNMLHSSPLKSKST